MFHRLKKFLKSTPIHFNGKPLATWKLLLPIALVVISALIYPIVKEATKPPTPDEVKLKEYEKAKEQADVLSDTVAKQTEVPKDETPNVATINDVNALADQEFFKVAKNGDKLLIYEKAKMIVLYRPSEDRVIATAPVLYNASPTPAVAATSSAEIISPTPVQ